MIQDNKIKISIILAVYNCAKYLKESVDSILNQTFTEFELILINDGSTDSTDTIIAQYTDKRIVYVKNEFNLGLVSSLNKGITLSRGKYIARMDADDIALANRLKIQYHFMESHPEIGICGSSIEAFWSETKKHQQVDFATDDLSIRAFTFFQSPFCHPTIMIRKEILEKNKLCYSSDYYRAEDYALWIDILRYTQAANIPTVLLRYRKHEESETALADKKMNERIGIVKRVHEKYLRQNGISLDEQQLWSYTSFTDRSLLCDLSFGKQKELHKVLANFLTQLSIQHSELFSDTQQYLSINTFYKFFVTRNFPQILFLQKLYMKGVFVYLKRKVLHGK